MHAAPVGRWATIPNLLSLLRLALVPALVGFAWAGSPRVCFWLLAAALGTDLVDGPIARRLGQETSLGASLDSVSDLGLFLVIVFGGWRLFPEVIRQISGLILAALVLGAAAQVVSLARFRRPASFHTWIAKATGAVAALAVLSLFWTRTNTWSAYLAGVMGVVAQAEQVAIAVTLRTWQTDMISWWQIRRQ
jgi:phosphatidylglycerophosphate synthase